MPAEVHSMDWDRMKEGAARCITHAFVVTKQGPLGLVPRQTQPGDLVCISAASQMPFMLRQEGAFWKWIGGAYIDGIMSGEALPNARPEDVRLFDLK